MRILIMLLLFGHQLLAAAESTPPRLQPQATLVASLLHYRAAYLPWWRNLPAAQRKELTRKRHRDAIGPLMQDLQAAHGVAWRLFQEDAGRRKEGKFLRAWLRDDKPLAVEAQLWQACRKRLTKALPQDDPLRAALPAHGDRSGDAIGGLLARWQLCASYQERQELEHDLGMLAEHQAAVAGSALASELQAQGIEAEWQQVLAGLKNWRQAILDALAAGGAAPAPAVLAELLPGLTRRILALRLRLAGVEEVLFVQRTEMSTGHWYESFGYYCNAPGRYMQHKNSRLAVLDLRTLSERDLLREPQGGIRDPMLHWDAERILFSYRPEERLNYQLFEIGVDGTGLRQITRSDQDNDIEPAYLPNDDIVFASSRCRRYVPCLNAPVATLYRAGNDGSAVRPLTANVETENSPWVMPDGRLLFMRWEYVERDRGFPHGLWTINPDGTGIMTFWGNMNEGDVFIDAKNIPGSNEVIFIAHPHGSGDKVGSVGILHPDDGPDEHRSIRWLTGDGQPHRNDGWRDPYPVAPGLYLACRYDRLYLLDDQGRKALLHQVDQDWIHEPHPIRVRPRPPMLPDRTDPSSATGEFILADVTQGRNIGDVARNEVERLLVLEILPKPVHHTGHTENLSYNGNFFMERSLGTVPVEDDGSAYFQAPAQRCLMFVALDAQGNEIKRMQSFVIVQPGERSSCVGCHENRTETSPRTSELQALARPPSRIEPPPAHIPSIMHFPRDIQPILDQHCVACHNDDKRASNLILDDDLDPYFNQAYIALRCRELIAAGFGGQNNKGNLPPGSVGAGASRLWQILQEGHQGVELSEQELQSIWYWIETWAQYSGTFAFLNRDSNCRNPVDMKLLKKNCASCHGDSRDDLFRQGVDAGPGPADLRETFGLRVNLSHPERSLLLRAPLSIAAGGLGICRQRPAVSQKYTRRGARKRISNWTLPPTEPEAAVFTSTDDPDYQAMLNQITAFATTELLGRMERDGRLPHRDWVREMQKNGHLPADFDAEQSRPLDFYFDIDERYYRSFWYQPSSGPAPAPAH